MTLRAEIHDAIDEVATASPHLESRVATFVVDHCRTRQAPSRPWRSPWSTKFRGLAATLAAVLVLVLMVGLVLGGRIWRERNAPPPAIDQAALQQLESRVLHLAAVQPGEPCPVTPVVLYPGGLGVGSGPIYLVDKEGQPSTGWGRWAVYSFVYAPSAAGPVLIRGADLQTNRGVVFAQSPLGLTYIVATGRVVGTDHLSGLAVQMRTEAAFRDPAQVGSAYKGKPPVPLYVMVGLQQGGSGCVGLQFDGPSFSETIVVDFSSYGL